MNTITITTLISNTQQKLHAKFHDATLCTQYAWWLIQAITKKTELQLVNASPLQWSNDHQKKLDAYLEKLINQDMPLQYLLGSTPFAGLDILVKPPVLIPRPETEEWCINLIDHLEPLRGQPLALLDLCTGSGCIALALADALPKARVYGTDISASALELAQENKQHNHIANVEFISSFLFDQIPSDFTFDLIVANPPYIPEDQWKTLDKSVTQWEDKQALLAADNGLALIKQLIEKAPQYLRANDALKKLKIPQLIFEIDYTQANAVTDYMQKHGYNQITVTQDLEGKDRTISGRIDNVAPTTHAQ